jgi:rod shape-determining protein MreC
LRTVAVGTGDTSRLKLPYLPTSADVQVGDLLVTSGLGGGFPVGYPVGTIARVRRDPAQSLADVDVKPAAALDRSRELMFVWLKPTPVTAAAAADAAAVTPPAPGASQAKAPANIQAKAPPKSAPATGASHP